MNTIQIRSFTDWNGETKPHWSLRSRLYIQNAHPTKLVVRAVGLIWATYFIWNLDWVFGAIAFIGSSLLGTALVWGADEDELANTLMGRWLLQLIHPVTVSCIYFGTLLLLWGFLEHSTPWILAGVSCSLLGLIWRNADPYDFNLRSRA